MTASVAQPLLQLRAIRFGYPDRPLLDGLDLDLLADQRVALLGPNGAGKSSLLHLLVGLQPIQAGEIIGFGKPLRSSTDFHALRSQVGLLFQDSDDQLFCPTVLEDVAFGPLNLGLTPQEARARALETLQILQLEPLAERVSHKLSGGEKRLVALATVLAMRPRVLLLDEPSNGLDDATRTRLLDHLLSLPLAMLFASHDQDLVARLATRVLTLQGGRLVEGLIHDHPHLHTHRHIHLASSDHAANAALPLHDHAHGIGADLAATQSSSRRNSPSM